MSNAEVLKQYIDSDCNLKLEALFPTYYDKSEWTDVNEVADLRDRLYKLRSLVQMNTQLRVAKEKQRFRIAKLLTSDSDNPSDWLAIVEIKDYKIFESKKNFIGWVTEEIEVE